jgi:hypothetical protein
MQAFEGDPILQVYHNENGDWQFHIGVDPGKARITLLRCRYTDDGTKGNFGKTAYIYELYVIFRPNQYKTMKTGITVFVLFLFRVSIAQEPGEFHLFSGVGIYKLGSQRSAADSNIYLQANGIINENGSVRHVYHYKNLDRITYEINGVRFQNLQLFYESEKLVRIDFVKVYGENTEKLNDSLRQEDLKALYPFMNQLGGAKGRKKVFAKYYFMFEKGYQWKKDDEITQLKIYNRVTSSSKEKMLIISTRYKSY